jgi:hypothetical protein
MKQENNSPTDVFNAFLTARYKGDLEAVKSTLSASSLKLIKSVAERQELPFIDALNRVANIQTYAEDGRLLKTRNEIIGIDDEACLEVEVIFSDEFKTFIFLKENNSWKFSPDMVFVKAVKIPTSWTEILFDRLKRVFTNLFGN